jgi:hypothetical protein
MSTTIIYRFLIGVVFWFLTLPVNAQLIDFDDISASGSFTGSTLTGEYASLGVEFSGSGEVLNILSNFEGVPLTSPLTLYNFLAFSIGANDTSTLVETIVFDSSLSYFDLDFAGSSGSVTLSIWDGISLVDQVELVAAANVWNEFSISAESFNKVEISAIGTDGTFVIDNLNFTAAVPVPAAIWLFISGLAGLFGIRKLK